MAGPHDSEMAFPDIQVGAIVHHSTFGAGKVVNRIGTDERSKVVVKFREEGEKKLSLKMANLKVDRPDNETKGGAS